MNKNHKLSRIGILFFLSLTIFIGASGYAQDQTPAEVKISQEEKPAVKSNNLSEWYKNIYFSLGVGPTGRLNAQDAGGTVKFDIGVVGNAAVGYRLIETEHGDFRIEFEWSRFYNSVDKINVNGSGAGFEDAKSTSIEVNAFMANFFYDFKFGDSRFKPYIGFGAGMVQDIINEWQTDSLIFLSTVGIPPGGGGANLKINEPIPMSKDTDYVGCLQVRAGLNYQLSEHFELFAGYRYFITDRFTIPFDLGTIGNGIAEFKPSAEFHGADFGLRFRF